MFIAEPSADRGPRRGSPAGVVDAPDAKVNFAVSRYLRGNLLRTQVESSIRRYRARFCNHIAYSN